MTKMAVLGRGSMRNKQQEEELRNSTDPKHSHLREELHVEITAFASPAEAHARLAFALTEVAYVSVFPYFSHLLLTQVRKYLIPDSNDQIRQQQMREIQVKEAAHKVYAGHNWRFQQANVLVYVLIHLHKLSFVLICSGTYEDV